MDRETFVNLLNQQSRISVSDALDMIREYCESKGKPAGQIAMLLKVLVANTGLLSQLIHDAKVYYMQKFEVTRVEKQIAPGRFEPIKYI